jgi:hypothetical protein
MQLCTDAILDLKAHPRRLVKQNWNGAEQQALTRVKQEIRLLSL